MMFDFSIACAAVTVMKDGQIEMAEVREKMRASRRQTTRLGTETRKARCDCT